MQFLKQTVFGFFDSTRKSFTIPVYQRAYSWREKEWRTFMEDLKEQIQGENNYFFGNILLETIQPDREFDVIDGQQRLTTLSIFIRSVITVLRDRIQQGELIDIDLSEKETTFLKNSGVIKLRPVEYDRACYDALIVDGKDTFQTSTPSQKNIQNGRAWFVKELSKIQTNDIIKIIEKIEGTAITSIQFDGKKDAALMFELQNNRGKDLTNMERLKSYLMYQLYVYSPKEDADCNIEYISNLFKMIYILINDIVNLDEDEILIYHCNAFIRGYDYRNIDDIKASFKNSENKIKWINSFVEELHTTFSNMKKLESSKDQYYSLLKKLKIPAFAYPFLIKGYKYFGDDDLKLSELFNIMEVLVFRYVAIRSGATINSRLNQVLMQFKGDNNELRKALKQKLNLEHHWSDERFRNTLDGYMYTTPTVNYLLWRYEASIQNRGYVIGSFKLEDEQIEHISPKTAPGEAITFGYDVNALNKYDDDFVKDYLNSLGNLLLISGTHNRSIGNIAFSRKLDSYNSNPLLNQQGEIKSFAGVDIDGSPKWDREAIDKRHNVILAFSTTQWSF